jgi:hypothetical protein
MRHAIVLVLLGACAGTYSEADVRHLEERVGDANTRRMATALDRALSSKHLEEVPAPVADHAVTKVQWSDGTIDDLAGQGYGYGYATPAHMQALEQVGTEVLDDGTAGGPVLVLGSQCGGNSCSCRHDTLYHFGQGRDGRLWLVRLHVTWQARNVHQEGSCGYGCGVPAPPEPASFYPLPAGGLAGFVDRDVIQEEVSVSCDQMIPAP